ncbi:MAG: EAL domain-containing response regulator [Myxococcota bacterium]
MKSRCVVIVDDEPQVSAAVARCAAKLGFESIQFHDAQSALDHLRTGETAVLVSDIRMPQMTGIELLRAVRAIDVDLPVVLMTGAPDVESAMEAVELGALRYLAKPISVEAMRETLQYAVSLHELARLKNEALSARGIDGRLDSDRISLDVNFANALSKLWMAFQPIVDLGARRVIAYEALLRSSEPALPHPGVFIEAAMTLGRLPDLSRAIRRAVAERAAELDPAIDIFVNLHPHDLLDEDLFGLHAPLSNIAGRVVLELTERMSLADIPDVRRRTQRLRALGYRLAIDDLGAGYAGLSSMVLVQPEVVKLDMTLIRDIDLDQTKQRLVASITQLCGEMNVLTVAEGIEREGERDVVSQLGCDRMQGYFFGRPARAFATVSFADPVPSSALSLRGSAGA